MLTPNRVVVIILLAAGFNIAGSLLMCKFDLKA